MQKRGHRIWVAIVAASLGFGTAAIGAEDEAETLACDGTIVKRALCKPAHACSDAKNAQAIQTATGSGHAPSRSNAITFTGIPASGAILHYEFTAPRLEASTLASPDLKQDDVVTVTLPNGGETSGALVLAQSKALEKSVAAGFTERLEIVERGSTLRTVGYSVRCTPKADH